MGTRSDVIVKCNDGKFRRIYCHWDGYLSCNGRILQDHYTTQELAEALVAPGDLSSLGPMCDEPPGHSYEKPVKGYTTYYGRDRGEEGVGHRVYNTLESAIKAPGGLNEYTYVWQDGGWFLYEETRGERGLYTPLAEAIAKEAAKEAAGDDEAEDA
jgi:hypothetical protein